MVGGGSPVGAPGNPIYYSICKTQYRDNVAKVTYGYMENLPDNNLLIICGKDIKVHTNLIYPMLSYFCEFENRLDDSNIRTGDGRALWQDGETNLYREPAGFYDNCRAHGQLTTPHIDSWGILAF